MKYLYAYYNYVILGFLENGFLFIIDLTVSFQKGRPSRSVVERFVVRHKNRFLDFQKSVSKEPVKQDIFKRTLHILYMSIQLNIPKWGSSFKNILVLGPGL